MNRSQIAELEGEFRRRGKEDPEADTVWRLASALLIDAATKAGDTPSQLLCSKELGPILGVNWQVVGRWKREGIIPAAIDEPGCLRFDLTEVRKALAKRAQLQTADAVR